MAVYQTQAEKRIFELIEEAVGSLGYEIVRVKSFHLGRSKTLQVMIDKQNGEDIVIDDCEAVSRRISTLLDVEDVIQDRYNLEVSSPGLNRPLTRLKDFENNIAKVAKITLFEAVESRRKFFASITAVEGEKISLEIKDPTLTAVIDYNNIEEAFLQYFDQNAKPSPRNKKPNRNKRGNK
jgi:ribosome maturation factor RimP